CWEKAGTHITETPLTGYKKINCRNRFPQYDTKVIAKVIIPIGTKVIRSTPCYTDSLGIGDCSISDKLRTEQLIVDKFYDYGLMHDLKEKDFCNCYSLHDNSFAYRKGKLHIPDKFDERESVECGNGLHFSLIVTVLKIINNYLFIFYYKKIIHALLKLFIFI